MQQRVRFLSLIKSYLITQTFAIIIIQTFKVLGIITSLSKFATKYVYMQEPIYSQKKKIKLEQNY